MDSTSATRIPFLVGFTGHRTLAPSAAAPVRAALRELLAELRAALPATPLTVMTGLADGTDRLIAEVAWELDVAVLAVLPMPLAQYREDFSRESQAWLEAALPRCRVLELPWLGAAEARAAHYEAQGAFLITHSQLLLACWDGAEGLDPATPCKRGGTGDVVRRHLAGDLPTTGPGHHLLDLEAHGHVVQIVSPRTETADLSSAGNVRWLVGGPANPKTDSDTRRELAGRTRLRLACQRTDRLNRDLARHGATAVPQPPLADPHLGLQTLPTTFARLDALANHFQGVVMGRLPKPEEGASLTAWFTRVRHAGVAQWVFSLAIAGLLCQQTSSLGRSDLGWLGALGALCLVATYGLILLTWRFDLQGRYLDYRAIAEGLRIACWWRIAGVDEAVADNYFNRQRGTGDWNRLILRAALLDRSAVPETLDPAARRALIAEHWFADQAAYFQRAAKRDEWNLSRLRRWGLGLFFASLVLLLGKPVAGLFGWVFPATGWLPFTIAAMQFIAAIALAYAGMLSLGEHAKSYQRMADIYERARAALATGAELATVCHELGCEGLIENAHWLVVHRQHPIEFGRSGVVVKALSAATKLRVPRR
jgi:hypothetical protein